MNTRLCTERSAWICTRHSSNSRASTVTRWRAARRRALLLPRRPRSSSVCSAIWRRRSPRRCAAAARRPASASSSWRCSASRPSPSRRSASAASNCGKPLCCSAPASDGRALLSMRATSASRAESGIDALDIDPERLRDRAALGLDLLRDLGGVEQRIAQRVDLVQDDEVRHRPVGEMVAPQLEVGARDAGVGAEHEDHRMRGRQQPERELGLDAERVEPRRVEHGQPALQQRMRVVDERVAPARDLDLALRVDGRIDFGMGVVPQAELARFVDACRARAGDLRQHLGQARRFAEVELEARPLRGVGAQFGERGDVAPGLDREQGNPGRRARLVAEFDRAHRRAPGRRGEDALAAPGEQHGVDQLGLAARELAHHGHRATVARQALAQRGAARRSRRRRAGRVSSRKRLDFVEGGEHRGAPALQCVEPGGERVGHAMRQGCGGRGRTILTERLAPAARRYNCSPRNTTRSLAALTVGAEVSRALALHDAPHGRAAQRARFAGAAVDARHELELAGRAVRVAKVAQRRSAQRQRRRQRVAQRGREALAARPGQAQAARARVDAGGEERLAGVDVARADDDVAAEQDRLDRAAARAQRGVQVGAVEAPRRRARCPGRRAAWPPDRGRARPTRARRRSAAGRSGAACRAR